MGHTKTRTQKQSVNCDSARSAWINFGFVWTRKQLGSSVKKRAFSMTTVGPREHIKSLCVFYFFCCVCSLETRSSAAGAVYLLNLYSFLSWLADRQFASRKFVIFQYSRVCWLHLLATGCSDLMTLNWIINLIENRIRVIPFSPFYGYSFCFYYLRQFR